MASSLTSILGILFLVLGIITTYLMFHFWGYPYDNEKKRSSCPQWKMNIHRGFGYAYTLVYLVMMSQMVPRLWTYQVEFSPSTVAHLCFGITIGFILMIKISIIRWFRHLEEWMPILGVILLLCTFLLTGLSLPIFFKERAFANEHAFQPETQERLLELLPMTSLDDGDGYADLVSSSGLRKGRSVLLNKCTHCHDLRTAMSRPRTPSDWERTVSRMAAKPGLGQSLTEIDQRHVIPYLIAITPELQKAQKARVQADTVRSQSQEALAEAQAAPATAAALDAPGADALAFQSHCAQCHSITEVEDFPPTTEEEVSDLLADMVDNGLEADGQDLQLIKAYLIRTYVK